MTEPGRPVAIVGAGISGLALATFLARDGREVTVLERAIDFAPVGAGFMLQALGQEVARQLGIADELRGRSSLIGAVDGRNGRGLQTMRFSYDEAVPGACAWGVHRGTLFELLHTAALEAGATIEAGCDVRASRVGRDGWMITDSAGNSRGPYSMLIGADGATSRIRSLSFRTRYDRPYGWGAIWSIVPDPAGLNADVLVQRYRGTRVTLGLLPTGGDRTSIFWSAPRRELDAIVAAGTEAFVHRVAPVAGPYAPLIEATHEAGLLAARYRDVAVHSVVGDRSALIGDAAHAMSPQLGVGASMGLADASTLAWALRTCASDDEALATYAGLRRSHVAYYRFWSRFMTPVFQSGLRPLGPPRDAALAVAARSGLARRQMVHMLMGARATPWSAWRLPR